MASSALSRCMKQRSRFGLDGSHWRTGRRGGHMVAQVRRHLCHAPRGARVADAPALAGEGHKVVVPTIVTLRPRKAVGQDATFEVSPNAWST